MKNCPIKGTSISLVNDLSTGWDQLQFVLMNDPLMQDYVKLTNQSQGIFSITDAEIRQDMYLEKNTVVKYPIRTLIPIMNTLIIPFLIDYLFLLYVFIIQKLVIDLILQTIYEKSLFTLSLHFHYLYFLILYKSFVINKQIKTTSFNNTQIHSHKQIYQMEGENSEYRAPRTVKTFFTQVHKFYSQRDTKKLAQTLKQLYFGNEYQNISLQSWNTTIKIAQQYSQFSDPITPHFVKILQLIKNYQLQKKAKQWQAAFDLHLKVVLQCLQLVKEMKDIQFIWVLKPIRILIRATKRIFLESMKHILNSSKLKNDLINTLNRFKSTRSFPEQVRVQVIPLIQNMQVSILFNFHNYEMIKMIVYTSKLSLNPENKFRDNFLFLKAKYALVNEKFREAEQHFQMINVKTVGQKRLVLKYLIPCKIFLGKMYEPRSNYPDQYFPQYETLIRALKNASFKSFDNAIEKYQKVWIKRGIYLLMDRLRVLIWRNLIKRVYHALGEKIMFEKIEKAVKLAGGDENINECICIIGNLIYEGYVKGYIFQNEQIRGLILKKDKCFPKLSDIVG